MTPNRREADVEIASIEVGARLRKPDLPTIAALAEDFAERGMLQRIGVRERRDGKHDLVWGRHRLEAAAKLGWPAVGAVVYPPDTPDAALDVLEIVENLRRRELSPEERAEHTVRLAALIKEQPGAKLSAPESLPGKRGGGRGKKGVVQAVADRAGMSQQAVRRAAGKASEAIGEAVDLVRDAPAELTRKADRIKAAPKRAKTKPRPNGVDGDRKAELAAPKARRIDVREAIHQLVAALPKDFDASRWAAEMPAFLRKNTAATIKDLRERLERLEGVLSGG